MLQRFIIIALSFLSVIMISCAANKKLSPAPLSGSVISTEWLKYNKFAEKNNAPKLVYLATCKKVTGSKGHRKAVDITEHFSDDDERFYIFARWNNVFDKHLFKLKVIDPRGVLFKEWESLYSFDGPDWTLWSYIFIRNGPASRLPGNWTAEIYMDNNLAATKNFYIGNNQTKYNKITFSKDTPAIAVAKFKYKGDGGHRYTWRMPNYIARMLSVDYPTCKVILPSEVMKYFSFSDVDNIEASIEDVINSPLLDELIEKHNIRMLILGSINDDGLVGETKTFNTYIVNTKDRTVVNKTTVHWSSLHDYDDKFAQLIIYGSHLTYQKTIKEGKQYIEDLIR